MSNPIPIIVGLDNPEEGFRRQHNYNVSISSAKFNTTGSVTLTANAATTTTTIPVNMIGASSIVLLQATTANAAAAVATTYISTVSAANSNFIITHANNAQTDKTFYYFIVG